MSRLLGGVGELLFFASLGLIGTILLAVLITLQVTLSTSTDLYYPLIAFCFSIVAVVALIAVGVSQGLAILWRVSRSVERRSAMTDKRTSKEAQHFKESSPFPTIPVDSELTASPGTRLRYRLPYLESPNRTLLGATIICFFLLGIASVSTVLAIENLRQGDRDWLLASVAAAAVVGAGWSVYFFMRQLLRSTAIGPTSLEISAHPLFPGQPCQIDLTQAGRMTLRRLQIDLTCFEEAIYEQGTNVRTERRDVFHVRVFDAKDISVNPEQSFSKQIEFEIPENIMHSFRASSNSIGWALIVRGVVVRWAKFERSFPVIIFPSNPQLAH